MKTWQLRGMFLGLCCAATCVLGQEAVRSVPSGESGGRSSRSARSPGGMPVPPGGPAQPPTTPDSKGGPATPEKKPEKPPEPPKVTTRPAKPVAPPNRDEFKIRPDKDGRIKFNFQGQPWPDVLVWVATISNLSLDWQEMPSDYLNLRTHRSYTIDEARDLVNRHLLDRGFTMLKHGEILSVVSVKKIDPSLVSRVAPADLDSHLPHEFVKVSFHLDSLMADGANEELKPMLSPNGKLSPMKKTNRIEAMDAVGNLLDIRKVLLAEQSDKGRERLVRKFKLEYIRAADLKPQLQDILGLEKTADPANAAGSSANAMQQQMMMARMGMGGGQPGGQPGAVPNANKPPPIYFIVNNRENSLLVNAPAEHMAVIAETVRLLDLPSERAKGQGLMQQVGRVRVHRLAALDPEPLIKILNEVGELDPSTHLQVDKKNRAIIVDGTLADHVTIAALVKKLDGTDRKFEVVKLRRLSADYVAGSIEFMMGGGDKKKNNRQNPMYEYMFGYGYGGGGRGNEQEDESKKFRVDADVEHNRLLLWANAVELEEVHHLLVKLGEIPDPNGNQSTTRTLESLSPEENRQLLERLRKVWPNVGNNPLEIDPRLAPKPETREDTEAIAPPTPRKTRLPIVTPPGKTTLHEAPPSLPRALPIVELAKADADEEAAPETRAPAPRAPEKRTENKAASSEEEPVEQRRNAAPAGARSASLAPIRIGRGADGQMVISSDDTEALDRMQDLLSEMTPARKDYKIYKMKYRTTWAPFVADNLKDFFEEKEKSKNRWGGYWDSMATALNGSGDERRLSKRKALKFIADIDSNTILVRGADANQLRIIEDLISAFDIPESSDSKSVRKTRVVKIQHSKARVIADAVKEVYRDLLSANDPALANNQSQQKQRAAESTFTYVYNSGDGDKKPDTPMKFKGMLSIGVDELSNMLIVSAAEGLLENVTSTIKILDEAAQPMVPRMQVVQVHRNVNAGELQKRLKALSIKPPPQQPARQHQQQQQRQEPPNPDSTTVIEN